MSTAVEKLLPNVAFAILALNWVLLVSAGPHQETSGAQCNVFNTYNEMIDVCHNNNIVITSEENERIISYLDFGKWRLVQQSPFVDELLFEMNCVNWVLKNYYSEDILMAAFFMLYWTKFSFQCFHFLQLKLDSSATNTEVSNEVTDPNIDVLVDSSTTNTEVSSEIIDRPFYFLSEYLKFYSMKCPEKVIISELMNKLFPETKSTTAPYINKVQFEYYWNMVKHTEMEGVGGKNSEKDHLEYLTVMNQTLTKHLPGCLLPSEKPENYFDMVERRNRIQELKPKFLEPVNGKSRASKIIQLLTEIDDTIDLSLSTE